MKKIYFVTGNKNKTEIFNKVMAPEFVVEGYTPAVEIPELESRDVREVVLDKLEKAVRTFPGLDGFLFVTDVGLYIKRLGGSPGALIKRETKRLFGGNFSLWCDYLQGEPRDAYVLMIIAARDNFGKEIFIDHKVEGTIPTRPLPGPYGFAWDDIFVPKQSAGEYEGRSFAQIPESMKFDILMYPAIMRFKDELRKA